MNGIVSTDIQGALDRSDPRKLCPVPDRKNIFVLVARQVEQVDAVREVLGFLPFVVHLFAVQHPVRQHLHRRVKALPAMGHKIRAPELFVAVKRRRILPLLQSRGKGPQFLLPWRWQCSQHVNNSWQAFTRACHSMQAPRRIGRRNHLSLPRHLPPHRAVVDDVTPHQPLLAVEQIGTQDRHPVRRNLETRSPGEGNEAPNIDGVSQTVSAAIELGAVLVE